MGEIAVDAHGPLGDLVWPTNGRLILLHRGHLDFTKRPHVRHVARLGSLLMESEVEVEGRLRGGQVEGLDVDLVLRAFVLLAVLLVLWTPHRECPAGNEDHLEGDLLSLLRPDGLGVPLRQFGGPREAGQNDGHDDA